MLFIGRHADVIDAGMDGERSEQFLERPLDEAAGSLELDEHDWTVGDIVVWDNCCVLEGPAVDLQQVWVMKHTRIKGDPVTEAALARRNGSRACRVTLEPIVRTARV